MVAAKDLRVEWRTASAASAAFPFALASLLVFSLGLDPGSDPAGNLPGVLWATLAFAAVVSASRSMAAEGAVDPLVGLSLAPIDRGAVFAGKALACAVQLFALQLVLLPVAAIFFESDLRPATLPLVGVGLVHTVGLAVLGILLAAVAARVARGDAIVATLLLPAATPLLLSAVATTRDALAGRSLLAGPCGWLLVAVGLDVLYFVIGVATFEFVLVE